MATDQLAPLGPRLSKGRIAGLALIGALTATAGWLAGTGFVRAFGAHACGLEHGCNGFGTAGYIAGGILLGIATLIPAMLTAHGEAELTETGSTSDGVVALGWLALVLLGVYPANGAPHPWLLLPVPVLLLCAVLADRQAARRWRTDLLEKRHRAERQARLDEHGRTVPGRVTDLTAVGTDSDGRPQLRVTVGFTALDGTRHSTGTTDVFPAHDTPRRGDPAEVRYDPADPEHTGVTFPTDRPAPGPEPADAAPEVVTALERLAALHREGALDDGEFTLAKALVLRPGSACVHPPVPPQDAAVHPAVRPTTADRR
ncbi:DUF3592 domain-containing protein [Kitasatospora sp. NPDC093806]|uniref:DUF3592 domain-containing protein n=1 Tax=Kitasatospora sp. NPDC093806 TaxID=3155075 RepID=UPI00341EEA33